MEDPITQEIIGAAYRVYNTLGFGFLEKVYENALLIEFDRIKLAVAAQEPLNVYYEGQKVGHFTADFIVENRIIVELKTVTTLLPLHEAQLVNYLTATGIEAGLLLNFGEKSVQVKRKFRTYKPKSC